jgi:hypothetical protein
MDSVSLEQVCARDAVLNHIQLGDVAKYLPVDPMTEGMIKIEAVS